MWDVIIICSEQKKDFLWTLTAALRAVSKLHMHWVKAPAGRLIAARQKFQQLQKAKKYILHGGRNREPINSFKCFRTSIKNQLYSTKCHLYCYVTTHKKWKWPSRDDPLLPIVDCNMGENVTLARRWCFAMQRYQTFRDSHGWLNFPSRWINLNYLVQWSLALVGTIPTQVAQVVS